MKSRTKCSIWKVTETYDENQIQVLEAWKPSASARACTSALPRARGLHHLVVRSSTTRSTRRSRATARNIEVTIEKGDIIRVTDNGRGIPCGIHPQMGIPTLEVVLTVLHAGGKFDGSGYKVSGGLHGVSARRS